MSSAKPLCVLCERPTADGAVQAVNVDNEKLQTWLLNVCGYELAEEIEDQDLICLFCIWHAEFLAKHGLNFGADSWWPQDELYLDDVAKELRNYYFEGMVEQSWVQLEKVQESESDESEIETESRTKTTQKMSKCPYCDKSYKFRSNLAKHVKKAHKNAIRCDNRNCATYFHTIEEKEEHARNFHETPKERKIVQCCFCEKEFQVNKNCHLHVRQFHAEYPVKCSFRGCIKYFKTEEEMNSHFDLAHKEKDKAKAHECKYCGFRAKKKINLERHIATKHLPKTIKCKKCDKWFSTRKLLRSHDLQHHTFKICSICDGKVTAHYYSRHLTFQKCQRCKNKFECSGLLQTHLKSCKVTQLKCSKCQKSFSKMSALNYHDKRKHAGINSWRGLKHKNLGFKCDTCKRYFKNSITLANHVNSLHIAANLKHCAHCTKRFAFRYHLKNHLAMKHNLIERPFECDFCRWKCFRKSDLSGHIKRVHLESLRKKCAVCSKELSAWSMKKHLLCVHNKDEFD